MLRWEKLNALLHLSPGNPSMILNALSLFTKLNWLIERDMSEFLLGKKREWNSIPAFFEKKTEVISVFEYTDKDRFFH